MPTSPRPGGRLYLHLRLGDALELDTPAGTVRLTLEGKAVGRGSRYTVRIDNGPGLPVLLVKGRADQAPPSKLRPKSTNT